MSRTMRAVWVERPGGLEVLEQRELPLPEPKPGEVRIRVKAIGLNPVDAAWRRGEHLPPLPGVLGRDFAGVVDTFSGHAGGLEVGERVLGYAGSASNGTYAEYVCVPWELIAPIPKKLPFEQAAALPVAALTAELIASAVPRGAVCFVAGASGSVGTLVIAKLRLRGAHVGAATTSSTEGWRKLYRLGLMRDAVLRLDTLDPRRWREALFEPARGHEPFDAAIDLAGGALKQLCFDVVAPGGSVISGVEEPADFPVPIWDEARSPLIQRSLAFRFVQLGAVLRHTPRMRRGIQDPPGRAPWGWYREELARIAKQAAKDKAFLPFLDEVQVLGPLSAETARKGHALLDARAARGKLVMTVL